MNIKLSPHARERIKERGISEDEIKAALLAKYRMLPEAIPSRRCIRAELKNGPLIVVYVHGTEPRVIVTAWWDK